MKGTFHIPNKRGRGRDTQNYVTIGYPIMIIGAGQDKTIVHGGIWIKGLKEEEKIVNMQNMTMKGSKYLKYTPEIVN